MSTIEQRTVTTRVLTTPIPETLIEPKARRVGFTAFAVRVSQTIRDGVVGQPEAVIVGYPTKKDGERAAYRGDKSMPVYGFGDWDLRYGYTAKGIADAERFADDALAEFAAIDWENVQP